MQTVITYWQTPEDETAFLAYLQSLGNVLGFPNAWLRTKDEVGHKPITELMQQHNLDQLHFGLEQHVRGVEIEAREFDGTTLFGVDAMRSCLISYRRPKIRDTKTLGQSNLCAYWDYLNEDRTRMVPKEQDFVKWAKRVFTWVRKFTPKTHELNRSPYRTTKRAQQAFTEGQFTAGF